VVVAEVVALRRVAELRIPATEDIQLVVVRIRVVQDQELDTDWGLHQQCDTGLMLEECTEVDLRYIVLCFLFLSHCYYRKKQTAQSL